MARSIVAALLVGVAAAQSGSYITTLGGNGVLQGQFAASIIGGDACRTTYAVQCIQEDGCGQGMYTVSSGFGLTVTEGPYFKQFSISTATGGATVSLYESCSVSSKSSAICTAGVSEAYQGQSTSSTVTTTVTAEYGSLSVTAGSAPTGSCTSTGNAALPTAYVDVYKVMVPAAAVAAAVLV